MNTEIKQDFPYPKEEIDLREILFALGQRKLWILSITLLFLVTSIIFSLFLPDIYASNHFKAHSKMKLQARLLMQFPVWPILRE